MSTVPEYSKSQVNRAGAILVSNNSTPKEVSWALTVLSNWRGSHIYPINTFNSTLRTRLKGIDKSALVAQRLKRFPSIVSKLNRFQTMQLSRMQDIGGLRAVMSSLGKVHQLTKVYSTGRLQHSLVSSKDYILNPKNDGYRGIHLIFRYKNRFNQSYDGLHVELQIRTKLQHAWATAVETMGAYLGQALKSGEGTDKWKEFFSVTSSAFASIEDTSPVPGYESFNRNSLFEKVAELEASLDILKKLRGFAIATDHITREKGQGYFNLIVLNLDTRRLRVHPYPKHRLNEANEHYARVEKMARNGDNIEAVLVSAGPIEELKRAYPNYFLDTQAFIHQVQKIRSEIRKST